MSYTVSFLNDEDFERLPGQDMGSKVGVAYPSARQAYVRKSGSKVVDVFSAMHELEHLEGSSRGERFDEENQCYYKGFADIMDPVSQIASFIPGPWQAPAAIYSGGRGAYKAFGGGESKEGSEQQVQPQMQSLQAPQMVQPFASQVGGGMGAGGGLGQSSSATGGVRNLSQQPQFGDIENQRYGNISGRSPLMNVFGGM